MQISPALCTTEGLALLLYHHLSQRFLSALRAYVVVLVVYELVVVVVYVVVHHLPILVSLLLSFPLPAFSMTSLI